MFKLYLLGSIQLINNLLNFYKIQYDIPNRYLCNFHIRIEINNEYFNRNNLREYVIGVRGSAIRLIVTNIYEHFMMTDHRKKV